MSPLASARLPDFDEVREWDGDDFGNLMAFDLRGHHDFDVVERFLLIEATDGLDLTEGWDVSHGYRHCSPQGLYTYATTGGRGWTPVTHLEINNGAVMWCINHPWEPWASGFPAENIVDGAALVAANLPDPQDPDPRLVVASYRTGEGYVYMCHSCARSFGERLQADRWAAQAVTVP